MLVSPTSGCSAAARPFRSQTRPPRNSKSSTPRMGGGSFAFLELSSGREDHESQGADMIDFFGSGSPLTSNGIDSVLNAAGLGQAGLWSGLSVGTSGVGSLQDRRPKILFERHIFSRLTAGQYDAHDPDISQPTPGGYGPSGTHQYDRLNAAIQLDETAALKSASWGLGQIMGENFNPAGNPSVDAMVSDMVASEDSHLRAMVRFIE